MPNEVVQAKTQAFKSKLRRTYPELSEFAYKSDIADFGLNFDQVILSLHSVELCLQHLDKLGCHIREVLVNSRSEPRVEWDQLVLGSWDCKEHLCNPLSDHLGEILGSGEPLDAFL